MADGTPLPFDQGLGLIGLGVVKSAKVGRVFWSGGKPAMKAATKFAKKTDRVTLEMTKAGQKLLNSFSTGKQKWVYASSQFAKGAKGVVHVFRKAQVASNSIWKTIEEPILKNSVKIKEIIEHIIR
jgi:hypothetical protein